MRSSRLTPSRRRIGRRHFVVACGVPLNESNTITILSFWEGNPWNSIHETAVSIVPCHLQRQLVIDDIAYALSYALTDMPLDEFTRAAADGKLATSEQVAEAVQPSAGGVTSGWTR